MGKVPHTKVQISVIIATSRPRPLIWETLDSLINQTLEPSLFEVIVVLYGPRENHLTEIAEYMAKVKETVENPPSMRLLYTEDESMGNARNRGIESSTGNYITFVGDKDTMSPSYLNDLLSTAGLAKLPYELSPVNKLPLVQAYVLNARPSGVTDNFLTRGYRSCQGLPKIDRKSGMPLLTSSCGKLIPRAVIGDIRYSARITSGEDALFMTLISPRIKRIRLANPDSIYYRNLGTKEKGKKKKKTFGERFVSTCRLLGQYLVCLLQPWRYNSLFVLMRIVATLKRLGK